MTQEYVMKDSFWIQVTVNVNVINHNIEEQLYCKNCKYKKIVDKLVEESSEKNWWKWINL